MASRQNLHQELIRKLNITNVYYKAPSKLLYPCVLYELDDINVKKANNSIYKKDRRYKVTYMCLSPDPIVTRDNTTETVEDLMLSFDKCSFNKAYVSDNVYHYVFTLYY